MKAYKVELFDSDYQYVVIAESLTELERKMHERDIDIDDTRKVEDLEYYSDKIIF